MDRWAAECSMPVLGANVINTATGEPHFRPYTVINRKGIKIAVLGMITPRHTGVVARGIVARAPF